MQERKMASPPGRLRASAPAFPAGTPRARAAVGRPPSYPPDPMARYTSIDDVLASYPARFNADKAAGMDDRVHMNLTGANARDVTLHVNHGTLTMTDGAPAAEPTLTLTADADNWLAVENGDLNPMMAMMTGKVKMKGSVPFATKFMGLFGYGG